MFSFPELYEEVVSRAGGEQSTAEDVIKVERSVRIVLERFMAAGFNTWRVRNKTFLASAANPIVKLDKCVDDVLRVSVIRQGGETTSDLTRIDSSQYMQLSNKTREGLPSQYWLDRTEPPQLHVFPVGEDGGNELQVWYVERPDDFKRGQTEATSVPGRWLEALVTACAHDFAQKRPGADGTYNEPLIERLGKGAFGAQELAQRADRDRARYKYRIA